MLARVLKKNYRLTTLRLDRATVSEEASDALFLAVGENARSLLSLSFEGMELFDRHLTKASVPLAACKHLEEISFAKNSISLQGALSLSKGLLFAKKLAVLNLSGNAIGSKALTLLLESLQD